MSKAAEQKYLGLTGEAGRVHSLGKPFTDSYCGQNLAAIGTIMTLLPEPPARILDMGCGAGWTSIFLAKRGYEVVGQDIAEDMVELANENRALHGLAKSVNFVCNDYEDTSFSEEFDAVMFYDCLHHAEDERAALESAYRALRPGGMLVTHEPGEGHSSAEGSVEAMRLYGISERDMPPSLIIGHGRDIGFSSSRVFPMQQELIQLFYEKPVLPLLSKRAWRHAKRVLKAAFRPSHSANSIVVMIK